MQTGFGLPTRTDYAIELHWDGPVDQAQHLSLWLLPPWANRVLAFLRVLMMVVLAGLLLRRPLPKFPLLWPWQRAAAAAALLLAFGALSRPASANSPPSVPAPSANARPLNEPSPELQQELLKRLNEPELCAPTAPPSPIWVLKRVATACCSA